MNSGKRIVAIVDDDPAVCRALARLVRSLGFDAITYSSGEEILQNAAFPRPDFVLLDLHLPGLMGPQLLRVLRQQIHEAQIVMMTARDLAGMREACLAAGAWAYMTKPVQLADLARLLAPQMPAG